MTVAGGFGRWGTPATGLMNRDGGLRGWDGRVGGIIPSPSTRRTTFGYDNAGTRCNARGASGDSGGGTYILNVNASPGLEVGGLVGITDSASTFVADTGATTFLYLNHIKSWVEENTKVTIPPVVEPTLGCERGPGGGVTVSWDESANGWTLQKSGNLQEWENVGATISGIGSYTYSGNENRQFFRLKKP